MIDWKTGRIVVTSAEMTGPSWSLVSAGDWAALYGFQEQMLSDPCAPYGDLLPVIRDADLAIVNLETVLSERGSPILKGGPNLRGPAEVIHSLVGAGFGVAALANNHARDFGREALEDTIDLCTAHGIATVGAGVTMEQAWSPAMLDVCGTRVAVLAMAEHEEAAFWPGMDAGVAAWDIARAVEAVRQARETADLVVYQCHAGTEYNPVPAPRVCEGFHRLVDAGASLVIGHHPHVPAGIEEYHGGLIAYSLGNFLFDFTQHDLPARVHEGYLLGVTFAGASMVKAQIYPYRAVDGHHLEWLRDEGAEDLLAHMRRISRPLGDLALLREYWGAFCDELFVNRWRRRLPEIVGALGGDAADANAREGARGLRNLFRCEAHWDTIQTALNRIVERQAGSAPPEVVAEMRSLNRWLARD